MNDNTPTRRVATVEPSGLLVPTPPALDDAGKVAAVKSPNGELRVPRRKTPWLLAATGALASGLVLCAAKHPDEGVRLACAIGATVVQTFGAGISGGLEKKTKR